MKIKKWLAAASCIIPIWLSACSETPTEQQMDVKAEDSLEVAGTDWVEEEVNKVHGEADAVTARADALKTEIDTLLAHKGNPPLFTDVTSKHWAYSEIRYWSGLEVVTGYGDGSFKPEEPLKRVHAALLLARAMKLDTSHPTNPGFTDVNSSHPYYKVIATIANKKIVKGKPDGRFDPDGRLTRAQMAAILTSAYNLTGAVPQTFADVPTSYWAYKQISALAANDITTGYKEDNTFRPQNSVTRAQFSAFLYRTYK